MEKVEVIFTGKNGNQITKHLPYIPETGTYITILGILHVVKEVTYDMDRNIVKVNCKQIWQG